MSNGTRRSCLGEKTECKNSRETVPLRHCPFKMIRNYEELHHAKSCNTFANFRQSQKVIKKVHPTSDYQLCFISKVFFAEVLADIFPDTPAKSNGNWPKETIIYSVETRHYASITHP